MDELQLSAAHIVGNSMGGRIAIEMGLTAPERVDALGLLCPAVAWIKRGLHPIVRLLRPELGLLPHGFRRSVSSQSRRLPHDRDAIDPAVADLMVDEFRRIYQTAGARYAFLASARNIYLEAPFGRRGFYPRLRRARPAGPLHLGQPRLAGAGQVLASRPPVAAQRRAADAADVRPHPPGRATRRDPRPGAAIFARAESARPSRGTAKPDAAPGRPSGVSAQPDIIGAMAEMGLAGRRVRTGTSPRLTRRADPAWRLLLGRVLRGVAEQAQKRIPRADLDDRDPDYIREKLPLMWLIASLWYRGEVRGLGNIPESGPVLLVGNHSGGNMTPDTIVFTLAFNTYFGVERAFYQLAHNLVLSMPSLGSYASSAPSRRHTRTRARRSTPAPRCSSTPAATMRCTVPAGTATRSTSVAAPASSGWRSSGTCRSSPSSRSAGRRRRCS